MNKFKNTLNVVKEHTAKIIKSAETLANAKKTDEVVLLPLSLINRTTEPFVSLNPVDEAQRLRLEDSIKKVGLLKSNPVIIWRRKNGKKTDLVLIEGFSRCAVAKKLGIANVYCIIKEFKDAEEAEEAARFNEYARRHDDAKSLYQQFEKLNLVELKKEPGRLNEVVAKQLGISAHNAHKLLQINAKASDEVKTALRDGTISTASAFQSVAKEKKYSPKDKAFIQGVEFCLKHIKEKKSPDEIIKMANDSINKAVMK
ncbi:ParB N-terminal domain-containing protein [Treponema bryantii]|uniref:ParB N-terminal domain-containing protein n=1 Tax=Treponema bryantii TaxID=163 RepID=UPI0003B40BEA|nr:ParB N-terminal domain-containing protein [Treponema bryantii]